MFAVCTHLPALFALPNYCVPIQLSSSSQIHEVKLQRLICLLGLCCMFERDVWYCVVYKVGAIVV